MTTIRLDIVPAPRFGWLLADPGKPAEPFLTGTGAVEAAQQRLRWERDAFMLYMWPDWRPVLLVEGGPAGEIPRPVEETALFRATVSVPS